jgi:hypothetical protein
MKKIILISLIAVVAMAMVSSCQSYESGSYSHYSSEKTENAEQVEQNGFILKRVKPGDTLWEYSEEVYGTGYKWGEILQENPHLIGRLSYDSNRNLPVVIIYPGESVRIGGKEIYPSFSSSSRSTTKTISSSYKNEKGVSVAWWTWVIPSFLFLLVTVGVLWLRYATRHSRARERERRGQNRLIEEAMISNYGKKVRISWTENSFEVR